jgi:perosamine synthetase
MRLNLRTLPPAGNTISQRAIAASLQEALTGNLESEPLCRLMTQLTGLEHWILTNSGRSALSVMFMALETLRRNRNEVILPAYTSYSVPAAVVRAGFRVRLCDVDLESFGLSPKELERVITSRTLCIVSQHLYGIPSPIKPVHRIALDHGIPMVEDAAQAMGISCEDSSAGSMGEAAIFSLSRGKALSAAGGGLIGTKDKELVARCARVMPDNGSGGWRSRSIGLSSAVQTALMGVFIQPSLYWLPALLPFLELGASIYDPKFRLEPMSRFQETLAVRLLPGLKKLRALRERNANRLKQALEEFKGIWVCWPKLGHVGGFLRLPILVQDPAARARILVGLQRQGLGATAGYPVPLSELSDLKPFVAASDAEFPIAKRISEQLVTLPTHSWLLKRDIDRIVEVFRQCLR